MNANEKLTLSLPAGQVLTLDVASGAAGSITRLSDSAGGEPYSPVVISGSDLSFGPYGATRRYAIVLTVGTLEYSVAPADPVSEDEGTAAYASAAQGTLADSALQAADLAELHIQNAGVPDDAVQATLSRNPTGDDNALTFTAVAYGVGGNSITIEYLDPSANDAVLSVDVVGSAISVNLATDSEGAITSTAADVLAAIEADVGADALVTVAINTGDSGLADDGSGVVTALASAPMTGGAGTGIGLVVPGGLCSDTTNANVYRNDGTQPVPVWVQLGDVVV